MNNITRNIYTILLDELASGKFKPGSRLPSEMELAEKYNTNRMNAHRAVKELEKLGLVVRNKKSGTRFRKDIFPEDISSLRKEADRKVYVMYSEKPHWIHWNESTFKALEEELVQNDYTVNYCHIPSISKGRESFKKNLDEIAEKSSVLVIFPDTDDTIFLIRNSDLLLDFQIPVIMLNRTGESQPFDMVSFISLDPFGDGVTIGKLLRRRGFSKIIMLNEKSGKAFWGIKRCEGIELGLRQGSEDFKFTFENIATDEKSIEKVIGLIRDSKEDIALVAVNNYYAARFLDACQDWGISAPDDFELIAFDDNPLYRPYNLTSISTPFEETGRLTGKLICEKNWMNLYRGKISIKLPGNIIERKTFRVMNLI